MDYKEKYKRAMLHIANLEIAMERTTERNRFYEEEIERLNERLKECLV